MNNYSTHAATTSKHSRQLRHLPLKTSSGIVAAHLEPNSGHASVGAASSNRTNMSIGGGLGSIKMKMQQTQALKPQASVSTHQRSSENTDLQQSCLKEGGSESLEASRLLAN